MKSLLAVVAIVVGISGSLAMADSRLTYHCWFSRTCVPPNIGKDFTFSIVPGESGQSPEVTIDTYTAVVYYWPSHLRLLILPDETTDTLVSSEHDLAKRASVQLALRTGGHYTLECEQQ